MRSGTFRRNYPLIRVISLGILAQAFWYTGYSRCPASKNIWDELIRIEGGLSVVTRQKLNEVLYLKQEFEGCNLGKDSVYARLLHRIGYYEYALNNNIPTRNAIIFTEAAVRINSTGQKGCSERFLVNSYNNLGIYYQTIGVYNMALRYYDSALIIRKKFKDHELNLPELLMTRAVILNKAGDFQKSIDQFNLAIEEAGRTGDDRIMSAFLIQRAQAYLRQDLFNEALRDVTKAGELAKRSGYDWEVMNSMVIRADILSQTGDYDKALALYKEAIQLRIKTKHYAQVANDYTDLGNIYLYRIKNFSAAKICYRNAVAYAKIAGHSERMAKGHVNLGITSFEEHHDKEAERYYLRAFNDLNVPGGNSILGNPAASHLDLIGDKELVLVILKHKTELLLRQFQKTGDKKFLAACLQTALLTDTMITNIRYGQEGEQSKLFWRGWTREFFAIALEICYLANDTAHAFFFMDKSRAVLLNDHLNELGASSYLPKEELMKKLEFQGKVITAQQKLALYIPYSPAYDRQQLVVIEARERLEHYIKSLESKYPAYYQFKYADEVIPLHVFQKFLAAHHQSFIHYFMGDSVVYMLGSTPNGSRMIRQPKDHFNYGQIASFNRYCNSKQDLYNNYSSFISLSYSLYSTLFRPLQIPEGRVIISLDNFALPFEALCTDLSGSRFLVNDHAFSYVYSARYLFNNLKPLPPKGEFIGFAPVSFQHDKDLAELKHSAVALAKVAGYYKDPRLFTGTEASRKHFMQYMTDYRIVNIFSHASADTAAIEPLLYMQDSVIRLSELRALNPTAARLVVLSACQTNVGKYSKGEGVYSLARGFAFAGIPSVAATLWKADESSIYAITERFHYYLSQGKCKDIALQRAKMDFLKECHDEKTFPYFWASMIIIGNTEPLDRSPRTTYSVMWIIGVVSILFVAVLIMVKQK